MMDDSQIYMVVYSDDDPAVITHLLEHAAMTTGPRFPVIMTVAEYEEIKTRPGMAGMN